MQISEQCYIQMSTESPRDHECWFELTSGYLMIFCYTSFAAFVTAACQPLPMWQVWMGAPLREEVEDG